MNMVVYDMTIGVQEGTLDEVASIVFRHTGRPLTPRTSSFLGGDYYATIVGDSEILVHLNLDGDEVAEVEYPNCPVLIQVNGCQDVGSWTSFIHELGGTLIRQSQYEI